MASLDSFKCRKTLTVGSKAYEIYSLKAAEKNGFPASHSFRSRSRSCSKTCCATRTDAPSRRQDIEAVAAWTRQSRQT